MNKSDHAHDHHHEHDHHHHGSPGHSHAHHAPQNFNLAFALAVSLNLGFTLCEIFYALMANSMSLLADAAHNFGDVFGLVLAWGANWLLTRPSKERYSYGYKRTTILAAIANALILVGTSAIIGYEAIHKLLEVSIVNEKIVVVVALIGIFINGSTALLFMKGAEHDLNIKAAFTHLLADALVAVGVVLSALLIMFTGKMWIDPLISLIILLTILRGTWGLLRDSLGLIMDAVPHYIDHAGVKNYLKTLSGVTAVHDLHIWGLSTKEIALTAHLIMPDVRLSDADYKKINSDLKEKFKINHVTIQVEGGHEDYLCNHIETC